MNLQRKNISSPLKSSPIDFKFNRNGQFIKKKIMKVKYHIVIINVINIK